jgi:hypothetical protein
LGIENSRDTLVRDLPVASEKILSGTRMLPAIDDQHAFTFSLNVPFTIDTVSFSAIIAATFD